MHDEIADLDDKIEAIVEGLAAELLEQTAIGLNDAAQLLLTASDNPERVKSKGGYAAIVRRPCDPGKLFGKDETEIVIAPPIVRSALSPSGGYDWTHAPRAFFDQTGSPVASENATT